MRKGNGDAWATARAGLDILLADATPGAPQSLIDKVLEYAKIIRPAYSPHEWDNVAAEIRDRFGLDRDVHTIVAPVTAATAFDDLVEDGFFRDYLEYTRESESPTQFHFGSILACVSAAFARRPLVGWEAAPTYPNIYMLLVGPSGTRKSSALAKAVDLVRMAFPVVGSTPARVHIMADEGSPQGFAGALQRRNFEMTTISDGLIVASELTVLVGKETYKSALGQWLCSWYDNMAPTWSRALKDETYVLPAPYVCFGGASNMTWLRELPPALLKAGYMPRHLVFSAARKRHDMASPKFSPVLRAALIAQLQRVVVDIPEEMPLSPAAEALLETWYLSRVSKQEAQESDEHMGLWISRKQSHALKVAVVWQIIDDGPRDSLREEWLLRAIRLVDWMDQGVREVYVALGSTEESEVTDAVLAFIDHAGGRVALSRITRALKNKYNSRSVQSGVATLLQARIIKQDLTNPTEGMVLAMLGDTRADAR